LPQQWLRSPTLNLGRVASQQQRDGQDEAEEEDKRSDYADDATYAAQRRAGDEQYKPPSNGQPDSPTERQLTQRGYGGRCPKPAPAQSDCRSYQRRKAEANAILHLLVVVIDPLAVFCFELRNTHSRPALASDEVCPHMADLRLC
jgi:hypothetical protein